MKCTRIFIYLALCIPIFQISYATPPYLTIAIVIDQFAYNQLLKVQPYLKGGLKKLFDEGVFYVNAHHPHAAPATATGHTALNTGALPKDHGIVENNWLDENGQQIACDDDSAEKAAVLSPTGFYNYGKSAHHVMVDGISDQFARTSRTPQRHHVFALSTKSRSAICCANKLGKALWFDDVAGCYTSSKAYYDQLPAWVKNFNKEHMMEKLSPITWTLAYDSKDTCYQFPFTNNYRHTNRKKTLVGDTIAINTTDKNPYKPFTKNPAADKLLLQLAERCIQETLIKPGDDRLLLWVSFSTLDLVGHEFGPNALEELDILYHIDKNLDEFIKKIYKKYDPRKVLFILTADHGICPIPELMHAEGFYHAQRVLTKDFKKYIEDTIKPLYPDITNLITYIDGPNIFLNKNLIAKLDYQQQKALLRAIKGTVLNFSGVKKAWTKDELLNLPGDLSWPEVRFGAQLYGKRNGEIIYQTDPFTIFTHYPEGTHHISPYSYDTHVPLVLHQKGKLGHKIVAEKVWTTQVANTLAQLLKVPQPSASTFELLPELFKNKIVAKNDSCSSTLH